MDPNSLGLLFGSQKGYSKQQPEQPKCQTCRQKARQTDRKANRQTNRQSSSIKALPVYREEGHARPRVIFYALPRPVWFFRPHSTLGRNSDPNAHSKLESETLLKHPEHSKPGYDLTNSTCVKIRSPDDRQIPHPTLHTRHRRSLARLRRGICWRRPLKWILESVP